MSALIFRQRRIHFGEHALLRHINGLLSLVRLSGEWLQINQRVAKIARQQHREQTHQRGGESQHPTARARSGVAPPISEARWVIRHCLSLRKFPESSEGQKPRIPTGPSTLGHAHRLLSSPKKQRALFFFDLFSTPQHRRLLAAAHEWSRPISPLKGSAALVRVIDSRTIQIASGSDCIDPTRIALPNHGLLHRSAAKQSALAATP